MAAAALQLSRTALGAAFLRTVRRRGHSVAVFPLARRLAALVFRMLRYWRDYVYTREKVYEMRSRHQRTTGLGAAHKSLGYKLVPREPV